MVTQLTEDEVIVQMIHDDQIEEVRTHDEWKKTFADCWFYGLES